ncbi:MAG: FxSxx-COOH system tetratricopeptide repeat protein [Actinoplanes sp.]
MGPDHPGGPDQRNEASDNGRVYAVQNGSQVIVDRLVLPTEVGGAEPRVSLAPPTGRRDPRHPVRGRDQLLDSLIGTLEAPAGDSRVRLLHGLAGSGKTTVAIEVAARAAAEGITVWWVDGAAAHTAAAGMISVARQLGVAAEALRHGDAADLLWQALTGRPEPWVLVLDNVDRPEVLDGPGALTDGTGWLRPLTTGPGLVLVTSRDGDGEHWGRWAVRDDIGMLGPADAAQVLRDYAPGAGGADSAQALATRLGGLPIAIRICGSYLATTAEVPWPDAEAVATFDAYRAALDQGSDEPSAGSAVADDHRATVGRAWELSLDLLDERGLEQARPLLRVLSHLANAPVPYRLLVLPSVLATAPEFAGLTPAGLWRLLRALASIGLVELSTDTDPATLRVHPLVRDAGRRELGESPAEAWSITTGLLIRAGREMRSAPPEDPAAWPRWQALTAHALYLASALTGRPGEPSTEVLDCAIRAVGHLRARGMFDSADSAYRGLEDIGDRVLDADHPLLARIRHERALTHYYRGAHEQAETGFAAVLETRRRTLGADHPDLLRTRHALGRVLRVRGRFDEARAMLQSVYEAQRRILGPDHADTVATRHHLAKALQNLGAFDDSRAHYAEVLAIRRRTLGDHHPATLLTQHQLAGLDYSSGRFADAEEGYRHVLAVRRQVLGQDHPDTLHTRHGLGAAMIARGRHGAGEAVLREVLEARRQTLGEDHPDTLSTHDRIAAALIGLGRTAEAAVIYRRVLERRAGLLGDDHPATLITRQRLASVVVNHPGVTVPVMPSDGGTQ